MVAASLANNGFEDKILIGLNQEVIQQLSVKLCLVS